MTRALVVGGTGATGRRLVRALLDRDVDVRAIVRDVERVPSDLRENARLELVAGNVLDTTPADLRSLVEDCDAVASTLGHRVSLRGILGPPYRLVTETMRRLAHAVRANEPTSPVRFVLMNTAGAHRAGVDPPISFGQTAVLGILRVLIPPHADNEAAARFLEREIGSTHPSVEWVAVRPDGLFDEDEVGDYSAVPSPVRSAIFDAGRARRIQVADFMARLVTEDELWSEWKASMPVLYDRSSLPTSDERSV